MNNGFKVDFVGIGSGKCGSTWFYENLAKHPEICDKNPKELNYFSDLYNKHPPEWYHTQFGGCGELLKGEFSVTYMYHPEAAERIHRDYPEAKILAIVRDPVKRTYSDYLHFIRKGDIPSSYTFDEYIANEKNLVFGRYSEYLDNFYRQIPKEQIKVLVLEEMNEDLAATFRDVYEFIGVKDIDFLPEGIEDHKNVAVNYRFLWLENILVRTYRFMARRGYTRILEKLRRMGLPTLLRAINSTKRPIAEMSEECQGKLSDYFLTTNKTLSQQIDNDLRFWHLVDRSE